MKELNIDSTTVDELTSFPFLNNPTALANLKAELHKYMTAVEELDPNVDILEWWKRHEQDLPYWSSAMKDVLLVQPSSAASECVFSLLQNSFKAQQSTSLEDYIELSLITVIF